MQLNPYRDLPWEQLMPTARRKLLCSDKDYMFVLMECKAGTAQPPHSHPHTQVDYLLEVALSTMSMTCMLGSIFSFML